MAPAASASTDSVDGSCARSSGCMASLSRLRASSVGGQLVWQVALPLGALALPDATPGDLPRSRAVVARTAAMAFSRRGRTTPGSACVASEVFGGGHSPHTPVPPPWASAGEDARLVGGRGRGRVRVGLEFGFGLGFGLYARARFRVRARARGRGGIRVRVRVPPRKVGCLGLGLGIVLALVSPLRAR